jgi:rubrerythrin
MSDEVKLCIEILDKAIAFEEEGMRFFTERAESAPSQVERDIFRSLAKDEAGHRAYLMKLKTDLVRTRDVEVLVEGDHEHRPVRSIFEEALANVGDPYTAEPEELEILKGAMEVEKRGYTMYSQAAARVVSPRARELFEHLASEEQNHYRLLHNTHDYLQDPEGWHGYDESPLLDGG